MNIPADIKTPAYICDVAALKRNMALAARVRREAGCRVLLATKAFAMPAAFPFMRDSLDGTTASGLYEARLGHDTFGKEVHVYAPAFALDDIEDVVRYADHVYFNSAHQYNTFAPRVKAAGGKTGIRINPGYSNAAVGGDLYDPCAPYSRFGVTNEGLDDLPWDDIDILHVHALCESLHKGSSGLIDHVAKTLAPYVRRVKAVNFGGGHFIGNPGYDVDALIRALRDFRAAFNVETIIEPGAGLVYGAGYLASTVLDITHNEKDIAILDASASCHMPDVLEVPYTPDVIGTGGDHEYILAGNTCMTGDVIGTYRFPHPLKPGDRVVFADMMQYSFVKNTTFNGTPLPDIALLHEDGRYEVVKSFGYDDFAERLG
jgi:carboxynorspermidine decarboxylase